MKLTFDIEPVAQGRPRFSSFGKHMRAYDPPKSMYFKEQIKLMARKMLPEGYEPISEPVRVFMTFCRPLPKTLTKLNRQAHEQGKFYPRTRPDVDNYVKGLLDALSGIVYTDDNIIIQITADKKYSDKGRIEFEIEVI
ncbi:gp54 [Brochothrix phage BL3]|uniref:RusA-like Holliday junction resolvase n=1 Tax=Brochothrix phage BL3 TaxID=764562 RepID=UPI0001D9ADDF|nr:RusA-like Holliday junction resolvase [Brochothrix phage BL3]ADH03135.1 gp54 [Brochothrix phage BL3]